ncbi:putative bifunctional diguanylate cyclase/phosphodiesterase [Roseateles saccharophilus]|uniref:PAS domain S-box-containing protein/diguanylate cyclase (GGDEF)-like protein n=1 Tax=Roseateles saccharophilus TaxID=304 RepID=A0A4R3UK07_ROSSA|nr:GGDEF domain-containing phosphodiesterase [Roseateles saccharophilus]MDG0835119.1 phosphodiesterase [Roseateles saccharophilus]TCU89707.1 PAS domain S-box-containing protein/diguanylate cyclase (GGDEF)-like protein [Roseateles saccharophilus]
MARHSGSSEAPETHGGGVSSGLSTDLPPSTTLPPGPRRIHDRRGLRRLRRVGLAALAGLGGGLIVAWAVATEVLPPLLRLPQPAAAAPATALFIPMLLAALGLTALWRLGTWVLPLVVAGLLLGCGLPLLLEPQADPLGLLASAPLLSALALPLFAAVLNRTLLRRLGLTGRLASRREIARFGLLAGLAAPLLAGLLALAALLAAGLTPEGAARGALTLAGAWALALLSAGTALQTSSQQPRRSGRWPARVLAAAAALTQLGLAWLPDAGALLLVPQLLLSLHAQQATPRHNAGLGLGLLALWALTTPATPPAWAAAALLALLPLAVLALSQHRVREHDGWRSALDAQGLALAEWRLPEGRRHASARWLALTTPVDPTSRPGSTPLDWVRVAHPRDREPVRRALRELLAHAGRDQLGLSLRIAADGGDWRWHELQAHVPQRDRKGQARSLIATLADVSWRHTAEERERMSATIFQQSGEGLAVVDAQWRIVEVNPAYCDILHASREALVGRLAAPLSVANLRRSGHEAVEVQARLKAGQTWSGQIQAELDDGGRHVFSTRLSPVPEPDGISPRWRLLSLTDLGESLRQQELLRRSLRYDIATGLPNRDEFMSLLQQALLAANRDGFKLVICVIDLDDFGRVNVEQGQLVADAVLLQLSGRLQATLRRARGGAAADTADQLARLHGDEFAVLMRVQTADEGQRAIDRLLGLLSTPVSIRESRVGDGLALEVGASMGATLYPLDEADPETLLRHAGHALYRAKQLGRGSVQFHDPTLSERDEAGLIAVARLQRALDSNELLLYYQPQIDLRTGQVMGVEALLRWQHPDRGLLAPAHFLPLVAATGLSVQIGDWVIEQALAQAATWLDAGVNGGRGLPVSVNVGARQLGRHDFPQRLQELIRRQPPAVAHLLHLDVLESDALVETVATQALIQRCLSLGVGIALDDFGAGYSRLSSLKRLTVDTLKLDRSYVQGMLGDAQDLSLVESVIGLGRNIGCAVLAKGVESRAHARELLRLGCRLGQGNGIAAAMHASALPGWMEAFANSDWAGQLKAPTQAPL